jgi:hypothetical protein
MRKQLVSGGVAARKACLASDSGPRPLGRRNQFAVERPNMLHRRVVARRVRSRFFRDFSREEHAPGAAMIPDLIEFARGT